MSLALRETFEFLIGVLVERGLPKVSFLSMCATAESGIFKLTTGPQPSKSVDGYFSLKSSRTELSTGSSLNWKRKARFFAKKDLRRNIYFYQPPCQLLFFVENILLRTQN